MRYNKKYPHKNGPLIGHQPFMSMAPPVKAPHNGSRIGSQVDREYCSDCGQKKRACVCKRNPE